MELPLAFCESVYHLFGTADYSAFMASLDQPQPITVRLNPFKCMNVEGGGMPSDDRVPWYADGFYLKERLPFTFDPLFHAGSYYVQEASSMFVGHALSDTLSGIPVRMLDLCAAPGGKSTLYRSMLPEGSLLVANEPLRQRAQVLAENLTKWGHPETVVTSNYPADFSALPGFFDIIAADVPCSGEGMFRKDVQAVSEWNEANVIMCRDRQRQIVRDVWPSLRPGGFLLYSTCTYNVHENEENVEWIARELGAEVLKVSQRSEWNIAGSLWSANPSLPVCRFLPHRVRGEGFFMALLRKTEASSSVDWSNIRCRKTGRGKSEKSEVFLTEFRSWLNCPEAFRWQCRDNRVVAVPHAHGKEIQQLENVLYVLQAGVQVAEQKGRRWQPSHALALSVACASGSFPVYPLSYRQAIAYLHGEALVLPTDVSLGWVLLSYRGLFIGFVKNLGNRANNLYPDQWRIRSSYLPDLVPAVL